MKTFLSEVFVKDLLPCCIQVFLIDCTIHTVSKAVSFKDSFIAILTSPEGEVRHHQDLFTEKAMIGIIISEEI